MPVDELARWMSLRRIEYKEGKREEGKLARKRRNITGNRPPRRRRR